MSKFDRDSDNYNGWTNRETWAVALHINNDQGWQESVLEALRGRITDSPDPDSDDALPYDASIIIRESVERVTGLERIAWLSRDLETDRLDAVLSIREDIGSLWRVNWQELGAAFLSDIEEGD